VQPLISTTKTRYHENFAYYTNDSVIGKSLELYGEYGQHEINFFLWLANKDHVIYDIGANIGAYSVAFASSGAQVFSFEANPKNYTLLCKNTSHLKNVQPFYAAAGNEVKKIYCANFDESVEGNFGALNLSNNSGTLVDMIPLDTLAIADPTMIKIDVEGSELSVLRGLERKITDNLPVIVYEAHETEHFSEIYNYLKNLKYKLVWLQCLNFNADNFKKNSNNIFDNTALYSIVAWPPQAPQDILTGYEVLGPTDSCNRFL
jgi:FkbM family methyltransferase